MVFNKSVTNPYIRKCNSFIRKTNSQSRLQLQYMSHNNDLIVAVKHFLKSTWSYYTASQNIIIASIGLTHFIQGHICFIVSEFVACSRCLISLGYYLNFNIFDPGTLFISVVYFVNAIGSFMAIAVFFRFHAILNRLSKTGQALHPILRLTRNM